VDAAILFADIVLVLLGMGVDLNIVEGVGPVIKQPIRDIGGIGRLENLEDEKKFDYLIQTIKMIRTNLGEMPLIGFSGAPFTLACYLIEGKPSRDFVEARKMMNSAPELWNELMEKLTEAIIFYMTLQVKAGVQALQLFDSWAGYLTKEEYIKFVLPYSQKIFAALSDLKVPRIHFGTKTAPFLEDFAKVESEVIGVDSEINIGAAWKRIGLNRAVQGNLDPKVLLSDWDTIEKEVDKIFYSLPKREGFIFNLGHGVLPETKVETLKKLTDYVHSK
jgi:uroporphyrinogen decarboxylase